MTRLDLPLCDYHDEVFHGALEKKLKCHVCADQFHCQKCRDGQLCADCMQTIFERWKRQCGGKVRHADERAAREEAMRLQREKALTTKAYRCEWCGEWHVGSKAQ